MWGAIPSPSLEHSLHDTPRSQNPGGHERTGLHREANKQSHTSLGSSTTWSPPNAVLSIKPELSLSEECWGCSNCEQTGNPLLMFLRQAIFRYQSASLCPWKWCLVGEQRGGVDHSPFHSDPLRSVMNWGWNVLECEHFLQHLQRSSDVPWGWDWEQLCTGCQVHVFLLLIKTGGLWP